MSPHVVKRISNGNVRILIGGLAIMHLTQDETWQVAVLENTGAHRHKPRHSLSVRYYVEKPSGATSEKSEIELPRFSAGYRFIDIVSNEGRKRGGTLWNSTPRSFGNVGDFSSVAPKGVGFEKSKESTLTFCSIQGGIAYTAKPILDRNNRNRAYIWANRRFPILCNWAGIALSCKPRSEMIFRLAPNRVSRAVVPVTGTLVIEIDNDCRQVEHGSSDFPHYYNSPTRNLHGIVHESHWAELTPEKSGKVACNAMTASTISNGSDLFTALRS